MSGLFYVLKEACAICSVYLFKLKENNYQNQFKARFKNNPNASFSTYFLTFMKSKRLHCFLGDKRSVIKEIY